MRLEDVPMVCISLDRRSDRWASFQTRARAAGLEVTRVPAVDAKTFVAHEHPAVSLGTAHNIYYRTRRGHHEIDAPGAVGCSLSHFRVWEQLRASGAPAMIVFEDDAPIPADLRARLEEILRKLPAEWDMIQLQRTDYGGGVYGCKPVEAGKEGAPWELCTSLMGSYAYILSPRGAAALLKRAYPIELHVDAYMAYMSRMGHIRMLWNPLIDIPGPEDDSDIAHGQQSILHVPTNMERHGLIAVETTTILGLMAMAAVAGGLLSLAYGPRGR
jgi:glycosyl transferase family 25